eukprot:c28824_g3_i3 orf=3-308(-)
MFGRVAKLLVGASVATGAVGCIAAASNLNTDISSRAYADGEKQNGLLHTISSVLQNRDKQALEAVKQRILMTDGHVPPRLVQQAALCGSSTASPFDILVIGG